ncbi:MAG: polyprenol monophosphomannose synthase [Candidatus Magasanikbacteria bacterium]|nr:polyprenol monophosphomannose synthase [Candidatus Magasanikbacteria bacterium]
MSPVTVVVPTYNERENLPPLLSGIFSSLPEARVLIVDDNSPDGTAGLALSLRSQFPRLSVLRRERKEGLGPAYRHAFAEVLRDPEVETIVMMDADLSHDPAALPGLIAARANADVVVGSRYVPGGKLIGWESWRRLLSRGGNWYARSITRLPVADCTGGFNALATRLLRQLDLRQFSASGYAFQIELKYRLWRAAARFAELPITFRNRRTGESKISGHIIREAILAPWQMIWSNQ